MSACTAVVTLLERLNRPCLTTKNVTSGQIRIALDTLRHLHCIPFRILHLDPNGMELRKAFRISLRVCHSFHLINTGSRTRSNHVINVWPAINCHSVTILPAQRSKSGRFKKHPKPKRPTYPSSTVSGVLYVSEEPFVLVWSAKCSCVTQQEVKQHSRFKSHKSPIECKRGRRL